MCFRIVAYAVSIMLLEQTSTIIEKLYFRNKDILVYIIYLC